MSLFKVLRGDSSRISMDVTPFEDGRLYLCTDNSKVYIDQEVDGKQTRVCINPDIDAVTTKYVDLTLLESGWIGSEAPFTQTVKNQAINENDMLLVRALDDGATLDEIEAYNKTFSIITQGTAETHLGGVTFTTLKRPESDITVRLLMRGENADEAVPDPGNVTLDASDLHVTDTRGLVGEEMQEVVLQDALDAMADKLINIFDEAGSIDDEID